MDGIEVLIAIGHHGHRVAACESVHTAGFQISRGDCSNDSIILISLGLHGPLAISTEISTDSCQVNKEREGEENKSYAHGVGSSAPNTHRSWDFTRTKLAECLLTSGLLDGTSGKYRSRRRLGAIEDSARDTREDDCGLSLADCRVASLGLDGKRASLGLDGRRATLYMVVAHLGGSGSCTRAGAAGVSHQGVVTDT